MKKYTVLFLTTLLIWGNAGAQVLQADTAHAQTAKTQWYKNRWVKASVIPAVLIGYGVSTIGDNGFYSSHQAQKDVHGAFPKFASRVDDGLVLVPYAELVALNLLKIDCKHDLLNTGLLIVKSELILSAIVFPIKKYSRELRPDSSNYESFPSGHTAQAFLAASIVHREFRDKSQWYGVGAYTIAASVGAFRMLNNRHWESDVFAGAGIGILSAHIAYLTHKHRWGKNDMCLVPTFNGQTPGLYFSMSIK